MNNEVSKSDEGICNPWISFLEDPNERKRGLALALRFLRNPSEAEDVVQDACVRVFRQPGKERMSSYFLKTVQNLCFSRLVSRSRSMLAKAQSLAPSDEESEETSMPTPDPGFNPEANEERIENKRLRRIVGACSQKLTNREKALFLSYLRGHSNEEIAEAWGEDIKVIRKEMNAVIAKMRYRCRRENKKQGGQ